MGVTNAVIVVSSSNQRASLAAFEVEDGKKTF